MMLTLVSQASSWFIRVLRVAPLTLIRDRHCGYSTSLETRHAFHFTEFRGDDLDGYLAYTMEYDGQPMVNAYVSVVII